MILFKNSLKFNIKLLQIVNRFNKNLTQLQDIIVNEKGGADFI